MRTLSHTQSDYPSLNSMLSRPDVLVLGGGGLLGQEWLMGVLSGIEDATGFDLRGCEHFVGTSAGAIVAARLTGGRPLRRPDSTGEALESEGEDRPVRPGLRLARRAG